MIILNQEFLRYVGPREYIRGADLIKNFLTTVSKNKPVFEIVTFKILRPVLRCGYWHNHGEGPSDTPSVVVKWRNNFGEVFQTDFFETDDNILNRVKETPLVLTGLVLSGEYSGTIEVTKSFGTNDALDLLVAINKRLFELTLSSRGISNAFIEFLYLNDFQLLEKLTGPVSFHLVSSRVIGDKTFILSDLSYQIGQSNFCKSRICFSHSNRSD